MSYRSLEEAHLELGDQLGHVVLVPSGGVKGLLELSKRLLELERHGLLVEVMRKGRFDVYPFVRLRCPAVYPVVVYGVSMQSKSERLEMVCTG